MKIVAVKKIDNQKILNVDKKAHSISQKCSVVTQNVMEALNSKGSVLDIVYIIFDYITN